MQLLREPLLHFAVVGRSCSAAIPGSQDKREETTIAVQPVRIGEGDVRWLKQTWSSQWLREPTAEELKGLVNDLLNEKLMAREAEAMGLEQDDTIIRRRLAQKLKFLVEDTAQLAQPSEAELRQFYAANSARFETPGKLSFRQLYFNPEHRKDAEADARAELAALNPKVEPRQRQATGSCSATASTTLTSRRCRACSAPISRMRSSHFNRAHGTAR